ncbi:MAG: hypothetical protein FJX36_05375, partial [Alphaproteobacteria bacterium]|nr:hypothetical protein [Alphaproteobacteria bacterium]
MSDLVPTAIRHHRQRHRSVENCFRDNRQLFSAAHVMMTRAAAWSSVKAWAMGVARRRGAKRAKVALARKLAVIM